jgi:DEAD/DEAH box helicase domain-containing protein
VTRIESFLNILKRDSETGREIVHREDFPPSAARWGEFPEGLDGRIRGGLVDLGVERLYSHQAEAVRRTLEGEDLVVVTPTASGKTLCYNIPVLQRASEGAMSRSLYLFPMKALEQDQLGALRELSGACGLGDDVTAEIYDGDTPAHRRAKIRKVPPRVLITNPDMLHMGIIAYHEKWEEFLSGLEYIVLDEVHTYRGVFGSHVANVVRRLLRTAAHYGSKPRVIACSATIANPGEFVSRLVGRPVGVVEGSGAPEAARHFLFVNPETRSLSSVAARLLRSAVKEELATIVFTKSRKVTELIYTWTVQAEPRLRPFIGAYRAGYLPEERREIEDDLFSGKLKAVVSTSALEVGIDIGVLDVCVLAGYPGTITNTWQRGGRVGRQDRESLVIIVGGQDALDQYFMKHPGVFFETGFEPAIINPDNGPILKDHLRCAAAELPLHSEDPWFSSAPAVEARRDLEVTGGLVRSVGEDLWHSSRRYPQRDVNIRGIGESYTIFEEEVPAGAGEYRGGKREKDPGPRQKPRVIGSLDGSRVYAEGHPGSVYLHLGRQYQVTRLDLEHRNLWARPVKAGYFTQVSREKETEILRVRRSRLVRNFVVRLGDLKVTERVTGYEKKRIATGEKLSSHELDLPPSTFETVGFWIEIDDFIPEFLARKQLNFMGAIHALEHAAIALFPLFALCEPDDIGGISTPRHVQTEKGSVFFYDGYPGGVGLCEESYDHFEKLLERTFSLISECGCEEGCPSCIYSSKCGSGNVPLAKEGAVTVLSLLLDKPESRGWAQARHEDDEGPELLDETPPAGEDEGEAGGARVLVLDIETKRSADEVGGWGNAHLMGVAVAVVWDSRKEDFVTYFEEEVPALLSDMGRADLVVGFNLLGFDYKVLSAYDSGSLAGVPTFDILADVRKRLGFRLSLAHLAENTLGTSKSADGLQSLVWVREGRLDLVEEYCRKDVQITADLFRHGLEKGWLRFQNREGKLLELALDWDLEKIVEESKG